MPIPLNNPPSTGQFVVANNVIKSSITRIKSVIDDYNKDLKNLQKLSGHSFEDYKGDPPDTKNFKLLYSTSPDTLQRELYSYFVDTKTGTMWCKFRIFARGGNKDSWFVAK